MTTTFSTKEEIDKEAWFGGQKEKVVALLEALAEAKAKSQKHNEVLIGHEQTVAMWHDRTRKAEAELDEARKTEDNARDMLARIAVTVGKLPGEAVDEAVQRCVAAAQAEATRMREALLAVQRDSKHTGAASAEGTACACAQCAQVRAALALLPAVPEVKR